MTRKQELKVLTEDVRDRIGGKGVHVFVGTWMERPGCSLEVRMQSIQHGRRIVIHKWDDETTCSVRYVQGTWWRPKTEKQQGVEFARTDNVAFDAEAITSVAKEMI